MTKRLTQEQFLAKATKFASPNLDFSQAVYKDAKTKVKAFCKLHPKQTLYVPPDSVYCGKNSCPLCQQIRKNKCAKKQRLTQEQFLEKCKQLAHKNLDFSNTIYSRKILIKAYKCKLYQNFSCCQNWSCQGIYSQP